MFPSLPHSLTPFSASPAALSRRPFRPHLTELGGRHDIQRCAPSRRHGTAGQAVAWWQTGGGSTLWRRVPLLTAVQSHSCQTSVQILPVIAKVDFFRSVSQEFHVELKSLGGDLLHVYAIRRSLKRRVLLKYFPDHICGSSRHRLSRFFGLLSREVYVMLEPWCGDLLQPYGISEGLTVYIVLKWISNCLLLKMLAIIRKAIKTVTPLLTQEVDVVLKTLDGGSLRVYAIRRSLKLCVHL